MKSFNTPSGQITVDWWDGKPVISVKDNGDAATDEVSSSIHLDNHQTYELAMELLKNIDVYDTRGSH